MTYGLDSNVLIDVMKNDETAREVRRRSDSVQVAEIVWAETRDRLEQDPEFDREPDREEVYRKLDAEFVPFPQGADKEAEEMYDQGLHSPDNEILANYVNAGASGVMTRDGEMLETARKNDLDTEHIPAPEDLNARRIEGMFRR